MNDYNVEIGKRLKLLRDEQDYTIRHVEEKTGVAKTTIASYENGIVDQKIGPLKKLADFYNEDINWIIGEVTVRRINRK